MRPLRRVQVVGPSQYVDVAVLLLLMSITRAAAAAAGEGVEDILEVKALLARKCNALASPSAGLPTFL